MTEKNMENVEHIIQMNYFNVMLEPICLHDISVEESKCAYNAFRTFHDKNKPHISLLSKVVGKTISFMRRLFFIDCM